MVERLRRGKKNRMVITSDFEEYIKAILINLPSSSDFDVRKMSDFGRNFQKLDPNG